VLEPGAAEPRPGGGAGAQLLSGRHAEAVAEAADPSTQVHRIRTAEGTLFDGTWDEIVRGMRDACGEPEISLRSFMRRAARQIRDRTGREIPSHSAEAFLKAGARLGLLRIES
jgi:hypothetical protein